MFRSRRQLRIEPDGTLEIVDPDIDDLQLIRKVDPTFEVRSAPLVSCEPGAQRLRHTPADVSVGALHELTTRELSAAHSKAMKRLHEGGGIAPHGASSVSVMELKAELAARILKRCTLCARRCEVDRARGQRGACGLGPEAGVSDCFLHIGEEPEINPSLVIGVAGCGVRCRHCQQSHLLAVAPRGVRPMGSWLWSHVSELASAARTMSFGGASPDESLASILSFLAAGPDDVALPVVWNCHGYASVDALELLDGVVDVYLPDFKFGSNACARKLSGALRYPLAAKQAIGRMVGQGVPVIVRILVLPGHAECCHLPAIDFLAGLGAGNLTVSVLGQYHPAGGVRRGRMNRRPAADEVERVRSHASAAGLRLNGSGSNSNQKGWDR